MRSFSFAILLAASLPGYSQKLNPMENLGPDVPTPQSVVERMLEAGRVKPGDTVYDLGSGDGRIVIAAAHSTPRQQQKLIDQMLVSVRLGTS